MQYHPLRDYYITVVAEDKEQARLAVVRCFGIKWAGLRSEEDFDVEFFPGGEVGAELYAPEVNDISISKWWWRST